MDILISPFRERTTLPGTAEGGGITASTNGDIVSFVDTLGNVGFSVGETQPGTSTDYVSYNNSGSFTTTSIVSGAYSRWDITLNLALQTVTASYFDGGTLTLTNLLTNAPLATPMMDLNRLYFQSCGGESNSKSWAVDDFVMQTRVPAPTAGTVLGAGVLLLGRRRRRA